MSFLVVDISWRELGSTLFFLVVDISRKELGSTLFFLTVDISLSWKELRSTFVGGLVEG